MATPQALIDLFTTEFKPTAKAKPVPPKPVAKRAPFTNQTREEYLAASRHWTPVAAVYHVTAQICQCCGKEAEVVGSILIRHANPKCASTWECHRTNLPSHEHLPSEFFRHEESVEKCPSCLRAEVSICTIPIEHPHQLSFLPH